MKKYKVIQVDHKTPNVFCIRAERPDVVIQAGQCFNVGVPGMGINREYSMYSGAQEPYLDFLIRYIDDGLVSSRLRELTCGDYIEIDGPYGEFCISPGELNAKFILICSGTGIAPFHSFISTYRLANYKIIHGVRYSNEKYDYGEYPVGQYIPCISSNDSGNSSRVTDYLKSNPVDKDSLIYLCGNRNMIIDSIEILLNQGISGNQIITEVFF
jgi:ferredoxin-NADP reductase